MAVESPPRFEAKVVLKNLGHFILSKGIELPGHHLRADIADVLSISKQLGAAKLDIFPLHQMDDVDHRTAFGDQSGSDLDGFAGD